MYNNPNHDLQITHKLCSGGWKEYKTSKTFLRSYSRQTWQKSSVTIR